MNPNNNFQLFAQMTKVNVAQRTVEGIIANEARDLSGEIFDYDSSVPFFKQWSDNVSKATGGKSLGNVRVMHGNVVAGTTQEMYFNDDAKHIAVKAYIADDNEWNKVQAGCYTGFSIGGKYEKKWDTAEGKRFTANPHEYSIVDLPCNPEAQFTVVKAEGIEEMRKFVPEDLRKNIAEIIGEVTASGADGEAVLERLVEKALQKINQVKEDAMSNDLQKKHDDAVAALATAEQNLTKANSEKADLQKALDTAATQIAERDDLLTKAAERITGLDALVKEQGELIEKFNKAPAPVRASLTAIAKSQDVVGDADTVEPVLDPDGTVNKAATAIKSALLNPVVTR